MRPTPGSRPVRENVLVIWLGVLVIRFRQQFQAWLPEKSGRASEFSLAPEFETYVCLNDSPKRCSPSGLRSLWIFSA